MSDLDNKIVFSKNLQYYMDLHRISRSDLCAELNLKYSTVSEWLSAKKYPRMTKIEILAQYFNVQKADLIEKEKDAIPNRLGERYEISEKEKRLISAYRNQPEIQIAVDRLLKIDDSKKLQKQKHNKLT